MRHTKMFRKIAVCVIFLLIYFQSVSSLLCADRSNKGVINCTNGDVCFRHIDNITKQVTKGCNSPAVCENIEDGSVCTTCDTDFCNSGSNRIHLPIIFVVIMIASSMSNH